MCGIAGFVGLEDKRLIRKMCDVIEHRGPDDSGYFSDKGVCLGNRRLSIIDVRGGRSIYHNEDQTIWSTSNNEIYNYKEIMQKLEKLGHRFKTSCDSEVIVHAYEQYGPDCVKLFRGMFAFAVWDSKKQTLFLARDRLGIKPLYYAKVGGVFLFGSEIKSILEYPIKREVDLNVLSQYFSLRYAQGENTIFSGIKRLMPGRTLLLRDGKIKISRYWSISYNSGTHTEDYYEKTLLNLLKESVKLRLMSDVPLGVYLSGGLDSSSIVALMKEMTDTDIKTISIGFGSDDPVNELQYARKVAEHFGTDHHEITSDRSSIKLLPELLWHLDEPIAEATTVPTYILSRFSKKYLTVALTGEGGDEMFGGYVQYRSIMTANKFRMIPKFLLRGAVRMTPVKFMDRFFEYPTSLGQKGKERICEFISSSGDWAKSYTSLVSLFTENDRRQLYSENMGPEARNSDIPGWFRENYFRNTDSNNFLEKMFVAELNVWLPNYILLRLDKMTMANAIEGRVPFLDHKLAEFSATIPFNLKIRGMNEKYIFRKAMAGYLPKEISGRKKYPFFIPIHAWQDDIREIAGQILSESAVKKRGIFSYDYIKNALRNYKNSELIYSRQVWSMLSFEIWYRIFMEGENPEKIIS
jgi:asparagine synthase (glutamine-hydrolysing)